MKIHSLLIILHKQNSTAEKNLKENKLILGKEPIYFSETIPQILSIQCGLPQCPHENHQSILYIMDNFQTINCCFLGSIGSFRLPLLFLSNWSWLLSESREEIIVTFVHLNMSKKVTYSSAFIFLSNASTLLLCKTFNWEANLCEYIGKKTFQFKQFKRHQSSSFHQI